MDEKNLKETLDQIKDLFIHLRYDKDALIEFRPITTTANGKSFPDTENRRWWTPAEWTDEKNIAFLLELNSKGRNIFFGANPRLEKNAAGDAGVKWCPNFFTDFDHLPEGSDVDYIEKQILDAGIPIPTIVVNSGHGFHAYWNLTCPLPVEEWKPVQEKLVDILGGDSASKNPERLLRMPGFKNVKRKPFVDCKVARSNFDKNAMYSSDALQKIINEKFKEKVKKAEAENLETPDASPKTSGGSGDSQYQFNFQALNILKILVDEGKISVAEANKFASSRKEDICLQCVFLDFHNGKDSSPSFFLGINGLKKGIGTCFGCDLKGKRAAYTILQVVLQLRGKDSLDPEEIHRLAMEWEKEYPGVIRYDVFQLDYPANNLDTIMNRYFSIPSGQKDAGKYHLWFFRGGYYYFPRDSYLTLTEAGLKNILWDKLKKGKYWKKVSKDEKALFPFPVSHHYINQLMEVVRGHRNVEAKKIGYKPGEKVKDAFFINKLRPDLPPIDDLLVVENGILNIKLQEIIAKGDPNLFCATSLPVKYNINLPPPVTCIKTLEENLGKGDQIIQHYKRDALICLPNSNIQAFFVKIGLTGSGKGLDIRFTKLWLGCDNYVECEIESIGEKFGLQNWPGKLAAFISDEDTSSVRLEKMRQATVRFKKISGGDEVNVRIPGGIWENNVKLPTTIIYASTEIPKFANSTDEMVRRLVVEDHKSQWVDGDENIYPDRTGNPDINLESKMIKEKDAYFTHCVINIGMKHLLKDKGFKSTVETRKKCDEIMQDNSIYTGLWTAISEKADGEKIYFEDFFNIFKVWCYRNGNTEDLFSAKTKRQIMPRVLSSRLRKVVHFETKDIGKFHKKIILNRKLTEYGEELLKNFASGSYMINEGTEF